jgi:hypothetical protein
MFQHTIGQVCADSRVSNNISHAVMNGIIKLITKVSPLNTTAPTLKQKTENADI